MFCLFPSCFTTADAAAGSVDLEMGPRCYSHPLDPLGHPDYTRRPHKVPSWETFEQTPQFVCLRSLPDENFVDHGLGKVFWPNGDILLDPNLDENLARVKAMGGYVFNVGGFVGGSTPRGSFPKTATTHVHDVMGDRFLGMDIGEQDGRYIFVAKGRQHPFADTRSKQFLETYKYIQRVADIQGNWMSALHVYWYWHYPMKEGTVCLAGAETQNKVTSSPVQYAFIRGAGKQYGVHWFGNVALWNPWGYKGYFADNETCGPTKGTSLNLMRRLLYSQYMYNSVILSFEGSWFTNEYNPMKGGPLSPIGILQRDAVRFVKDQGQPGEMHAPVALLTDFFSGWMPARTEVCAYKVCNAIPYGPGDYLTHSVFSLLYPGYEDCGVYHDERGTYTNTPHGDMADAILTDISAWALERYGLVVAAGDLPSAGPELRGKMEHFVQNGGRFIVTAENARRLWPEWKFGNARSFPPNSTLDLADGGKVEEANAFELVPVDELPPSAGVVARCGKATAAADVPMGRGRVTLLLSPYGITAEALTGVQWKPGTRDKALEQPYVLLRHVRNVLKDAIEAQQLFSVGDNLGFITCRKGPGQYTLGVFNNGLEQRPFKIAARLGSIESVEELNLGQSLQRETGYWPGGFEENDGGVSNEINIAGGDVRLFSVTLREQGIREAQPVRPAPRPRNRFLAMRDIKDLQEALLLFPTFFEHFDGVKLEWTYLLHRDAAQLKRDKPWLDRQQLRLMVDFSGDLNHFPGLTLLDFDHDEYADSVAQENDVFDKMALVGARDAVICLHAAPEFGVEPEAVRALFVEGLRDFCRRAKLRGIAVHLQNLASHRWGGSSQEVPALIEETGAENLHFALNTADDPTISTAIQKAGTRLGMVLLSAPGQPTREMQVPLSRTDMSLKGLESIDKPLVLDASYADQHEVYLDIKQLAEVWK